MPCMLKKTYFPIFLICIGCWNCNAQKIKTIETEAQLLKPSYYSKATEAERNYFLYLPKTYGDDKEKEWPVLMFLHGNGERGNGLDELDYAMIHGPLYEAWIQKKELPFIIIAPQLPMFGMDEKASYIKNRTRDQIPIRLDKGVPERPGDFPTEGPMNGQLADNEMKFPEEGLPMGWPVIEEDLLWMLQTTKVNYNVDDNRVYLSGLSYGGFGTWWMASKHPDLFAAIAPVVGYAHPDLMEPIAKNKIPVWAFAGGRDYVVPVKYFYASLNKLESLGHKPRFTIHSDMNHDAWTRIYRGWDLYDWFLTHTK